MSQDFHILGGSIVSCGMDHSLKLWQLDTSEIKDAIEASEQHSPTKKLVIVQSVTFNICGSTVFIVGCMVLVETPD